MHANALLMARLYAALRDHHPDVAAGCYAEDAAFEDIAFRLRGRARIGEMWRMVCDPDAEVRVTRLHVDFADDARGGGTWRAEYRFNKDKALPGRPVANDSVSEFEFRNGEIIRHCDRADARAWARQAYPFPLSIAIGWIAPLRRFGAERTLRKFLAAHPARTGDSA